MTRKTKLTIWLVAGIPLSLGPFWGLIGTVVGMVCAFSRLSQSTAPDVGSLAGDISMALYATIIGGIACPFGIAMMLIAGIKLLNMRDAEPPDLEEEA
jgi:biopolymer transport protein ExbB/TolQ